MFHAVFVIFTRYRNHSACALAYNASCQRRADLRGRKTGVKYNGHYHEMTYVGYGKYISTESCPTVISGPYIAD